ncbi:hypothetical protein N9Y92_00945 [Chlamydiales bacterium]|nr:hypothetical protein [Chlamydiales bacterium]
MPIILTPQLRNIFQEEQSITFQDFLPENQWKLLKTGLQEQDPNTPRDLFRNNEKVKKILFKKDLSTIALDLVESRKLLFAFDHFIKNPPFYPNPISLQELSSVSPLAIGAILSIYDNSITYFDPQVVIDWNEMTKKEGLYLLFAYGEQGAIFHQNPLDPYTNLIKDMGYPPSCPLSTRTHPTLRAQ